MDDLDSEPAATAAPPPIGLLALFARFLWFGMNAWGGPVAQIALLRERLVERERWAEPERFNRVLALYQALPGPEAAELCVWFGQRARGRVGGLVAGLGFIVPGFLLMLAATWAYVTTGPFDGRSLAALVAMQVAAIALVARGAWNIGARSLTDRTTVVIAAVAAAASFAGVHFAVVLCGAGLVLEVARRHRGIGVALLVVLAAASLGLAVHRSSWDGLRAPAADAAASSGTTSDAGLAEVGILGLKAGALSFGGAYTAIPLLQQDAVEQGGWLTEQELLQGVALVSVMPAPLVIVVTYVGGIAAGAAGALVMTIAILLPAFVITLFGHRSLERIVDQPRVHDLLDGVVAGVVGLIGVTALSLAATLVDTLLLAAILVAALVTLHAWRSIRASAFVVLAAGAFGAVLGPAFGL